MNRSQREADDLLNQLEKQKQEVTKVRQDGESELERVAGVAFPTDVFLFLHIIFINFNLFFVIETILFHAFV